MNDPSAALVAFVAISAKSRYFWIAGQTWVLYDWLISLNQEIDLVWRRSGAWQSKLLYALTRYYGLALTTWNVVMILHSNWSVAFCRVYFYLTGITGLAQMCAAQGALLLRIYVMYNRSFKIMATSIALFVIELISMATVHFLDVRDLIPMPVPAPATGCYGMSQHPALASAYWSICLVFETYMFILALGSAYFNWKDAATSRPNILTVMIRDSLLWYVYLGLCLFLNTLAFTAKGMQMLAIIGIPALQTTATVGGSRFLLSLRAAYFSSTRDMGSTHMGFPRSTRYTATEGTVGVFRPFISDLKDEGDDRFGNEAGSVEMGIRISKAPKRDRSPSPPAMILEPISLAWRDSDIRLKPSANQDNAEEIGVSTSHSSEPAHSAMRLDSHRPTASNTDAT